MMSNTLYLLTSGCGVGKTTILRETFNVPAMQRVSYWGQTIGITPIYQTSKMKWLTEPRWQTDKEKRARVEAFLDDQILNSEKDIIMDVSQYLTSLIKKYEDKIHIEVIVLTATDQEITARRCSRKSAPNSKKPKQITAKRAVSVNHSLMKKYPVHMTQQELVEFLAKH
jgi:guanylate kinase